MQGKSRMDYIYINGEEQVLIEPQQISVRND